MPVTIEAIELIGCAFDCRISLMNNGRKLTSVKSPLHKTASPYSNRYLKHSITRVSLSSIRAASKSNRAP